MTVNTTNITGFVVLPDDTIREKSSIIFRMTGFDTDGDDDAVVVPYPITAPIAVDGSIDVDLWPNPEGVRATLYQVSASIYNGVNPVTVNLGRVSVPVTGGPYSLNDLLPIDPNSPANPSIQQMIDELRARDDQEEAARISSDNSLSARINAEQSARIAGDNTLDARIDNLSSGIFYAGTFDPDGGSFPSGSLRGGTYRATSSGTVGGQAFDIGDRITAKVDGASTSVFTGNWDRASTSAELADLDAKFSDTLRFYGAVGDGVTDDTAAVSAADAAAGPYIDMEGLTYITTINLSTLTKKYYNGTMYGQNSSGNQSVLANETPYQEAEIRQLGTKSRFFDWAGSDILWLGTSIPQFGIGDGSYPELSADALNASVTNLAWAGSHATFDDLDDIDPDGDINQIKALSMTDADVAAGLALYGSGSVFDDSYDPITKASDMTLDTRIVEPFQATDFDVVVLDHNHNDRRDAWGTLTPESTAITGINKASQATVAVANIGTISVGDFVAMRQTGITGLDYAFGRVQAVSGSNVQIDYSTTGMVGSFASGTLYKLDRSTLFGSFEACIYAVKNSSLRYGSGNVHIILCGAPSEFTNDSPDNDIRSIAVAIGQVADKWGFPFFDVATALSVNEQDHLFYFPDAVHPSTRETREILSRYWVEWMRGGRDLTLSKSDFVLSSGVDPVERSPYVYDRFSGGALATGVSFGDGVAVHSDDFTGTLAAYTTAGTAPVIVDAPWGGGEKVIQTVTSAVEGTSRISKAETFTTDVYCDLDFQFSTIGTIPTLTKQVNIAEFVGGAFGLTYALTLLVFTDGTVKLRLTYFDSEGALKNRTFDGGPLSPNTKYNVKLEAVSDIGDGSGRVLLYLDGVLNSRVVVDTAGLLASNTLRVGQSGSNLGGDLTVHIGNIVFGDVPIQTVSTIDEKLDLKADLVGGVVPAVQLPVYIDEIVEVADFASLPATGVTNIIYVTLDDDLTYRWGGTGYAEISGGLALGETDSTAYPGDLGKDTADALSVVEGRVIVVTAGYGGTGDAYTANASSIPANGQYLDFQAPADSIGSTPTLAITFGVDTVTTSLRDSDGLPLTRPLKSGTRYLIRYGAAASRVVAGWGADQEDVITPIQPASSIAASALSAPTLSGTQTQTPIVINNASTYTLQPFAQSVGVTATPAAPVVDLSLLIEGTSATIFSTSAQTWRLHSGATNFAGQSHNRATLTGEGHVIATRIGGRVCLTAGSGALTYDTAALPVAKQSFLGAGQSNEVFMHQHGGIGGFLDGVAKGSWMTEGVMLPSVYWIDGSTGGTALLEASVPGTNWWFDDATETNGIPLNACLAAINAAVTAGQPAPETITWTQGESDAAGMEAGWITVTQYKDALKEVWLRIRDRCISQGASDPQILVNEIGASDAAAFRRVGTSRVRQATLEAIAETSYAFYAATNVDVPRPWGDVHYTSNAYHALGRRRAHAWFNMCVDARGQGAWNPGTGAFPDAIAGQWWTASAGGTVDGLTVTSGQTIMCFSDAAADTTTTSNVWRVFDTSDVYDLGPTVALTSTSADGKTLTATFSGTGVVTPQGTKVGGVNALLEGGAPGGFCVVKANRTLIRIASVTWDATAKTATITCDEDATGATLHYLAGNMPEHRYGDYVRDGQVDTYTRIPGLPCRSGAFLVS